jgi:hypothetical protein
MVRADQVIASPAAVPGSDATKTASAGKPAAAPAPAEPAPAAAETAPSEDAAAESAVAERTAGGSASPRSVSYTSGSQSSSLSPQQAAAEVESASGRVLESGPGYTIKAASATPSAAGRGREAGVTNAPLERRHEPIVCQGSRLLHIDNRNLAFDGDAVSAEDGCEIHITNSHITAAGVGVLVRAANVHIDNSLIEGDQASIDASEGAQVFASATHFKGLSRRLDTATFHDLGGNIWN